MSIKNTILFILLALIAGFAVGEKFSKPKVKTKIVTVEKEIVKTNVVTKTKETKKPDGTVETETIIVDKTTKESQSESIVETKVDQKNRYIRASYAILGSTGYDIAYGQRVISNLFIDIGTSAKADLSDKQLKLGLSWSF